MTEHDAASSSSSAASSSGRRLLHGVPRSLCCLGLSRGATTALHLPRFLSGNRISVCTPHHLTTAAIHAGTTDTSPLHFLQPYHQPHQFLHGLDKRLDTLRIVLGDQELPFDTVLSRVILAEESQAQHDAEESASAFALPDGDRGSGAASADRTPADRTGGDRPQGPPHPPQQPSGHGRGDCSADGDRGLGPGRGRGRGRGESSGRGHPSQQAFSPFTSYFTPYGMALPSPRPGRVPPNAAGVLGPRPGAHAHAYPILSPSKILEEIKSVRVNESGDERANEQLMMTAAQWQARQRRQGGGSYNDDDDGAASTASGGGNKRRERCYGCGERGHLKRECPERKKLPAAEHALLAYVIGVDDGGLL
ncbi:hypothetical protein D1007_31701 [Hordeum vulgare]|nr:hypothetical protein D1007_31701 [Hordeum vulgare]